LLEKPQVNQRTEYLDPTGYYLPDPNADVHRASGIMVLTLGTEGISAITRFGDRSLLARFGLPRTVASR
jgi:RNA polymerase sigma-70 factor (ECF subfamily)